MLVNSSFSLCHQDIFSRTHPIHFLNSRALGIGVGRSQSPSKERESIFGFSAGSRRAPEIAGADQASSSPHSAEQSLFVGELNSDGCLEELLEHAQDVSMWVAVEICSASSTKVSNFVSLSFRNARSLSNKFSIIGKPYNHRLRLQITLNRIYQLNNYHAKRCNLVIWQIWQEP